MRAKMRKYNNGGLLAPNGKPSNLTFEQHKLVRSKAFKDWFGDWENDPENSSQVVDENGEPLVCNHSSREKNISVFYGSRIFRTPKTEVKPIWFSYKGVYAKHDEIQQYNCFLNVKKLFHFDKKQDVLLLENYMNEKYNNYDIDSDYDYSKNWEAIEDENLPAYIFELGFEGYITNVENAVVVYNSNQIKLADGKNTTFDQNSDDIRYQKGGLIAPNGNQSNLTPEQYKLVRTKAFKQWFGDWEKTPSKASKIVDQNGEPLVVYHGSRLKFNSFSIEKIGGKTKYAQDGFYFDIDKNNAKEYGNIIYPCFLRILTPLEADFEGYSFMGGKYDMNKLVGFVREGNVNWFGNKYDGVRAINVIDSPIDKSTTSSTIVVLKPNQIKLADGTNTTFDKKSDDIRYKKGGVIESNKKVRWSIFGFVVGILTLGTINSK